MLGCLGDGEIGRLLLDHVPAAVALFDREMRYLACSRRWLTDYRLQNTDIIGLSHYEVFPEIDERWRARHRRVLAGERLSSEMDSFKRANGALDWVEWEMVPWRDRAGEIGGAMLFSQLVTDRVESKQRAKALTAELDLLIDSAKRHAICLLDAEGKVVIWNAGAERLYGWGEAEVIGKPYDQFFDDRETGTPEFHLTEAGRQGTYRRRSWRVRKDGSRFLGDMTANCIRDETGAIVGFGTVVHDITEETDWIQQIEASAAHMRSIIATVPDGMVTINECGIIESFSAAAEGMFGYRADEVVGRDASLLMPEAAEHEAYLERYHATGERRVIGNKRRVFGRRKDGSVFPHELYVGEAFAGGRRIYTGFVRDLTAQEEAEAKLRGLQDELIHISRVSAASTMAAALAHELNQPLTAITNYVQTSAMLLSTGDKAALTQVPEALDKAGREALRAGAIVRRLRDFVAHGELEHSLEDPLELVSDACALAAFGAKPHGAECMVSIPSNLPPLLVDRVQLQQVILNLIRNAFQSMGDRGRVVISAVDDGRMIRFSVVDNGPGIDPETEAALFEPFISSKANGMGLGLAICQTIIEAHGGRLWYERPVEGGAAFHFTIPIVDVDRD